MELDLTGIHKLAAEQGIDPEPWMMRWQRPCASPTSRPRTPPSTRAWSLTNVPATSPCGPPTKFRSNPPKTTLTPFPSWARNTMTPRVTSAVSPQPPHARSSPSCSAAPKMRRYSVRSPAKRASSSPASFSRMLPTPPTCMSRWAMSKPFCLAVSRCPANVTATANASACTW